MMKRNVSNHMRSVWGTTALWTLLLVAVSGCTQEFDTNVGRSPVDDEEITILIGDDVTRGNYVEGPSLTQYAIYSFYNDTKKIYLNNSILTRANVGDPWKKSKTVKFPDATRALDFFAMAPMFKGDMISATTMTQDTKSIVHTLPTVNAQQRDFMFSSLMGQTRTATDNVIKFNFKHLFCYLRFQAKLSNENIDVVIHSVKLHNLKSTGTFLIDNDKANVGNWVLDGDKFDTYEFVLPQDSALTYKKTLTIHRTDSMLFVMPQNPTLFKFTEGSSFSEADEGKLAYASIMCRIKNKATGDYIGPCSDTTWAEVYYPLKSATWITTKQTYGTSKSVSIEFTGGYTYDGEDYLKTYSENGSIENESVEGIQGGVDASADWEDDVENSVTITL